MVEVLFNITDSPKYVSTLTELRQGENLSTKLNLVLNDDSFIGYSYLFIFQLNSETPIISETIAPIDNIISYTLTNTLTKDIGVLKVEIQAFDDYDYLKKTAIFYFNIKPSLSC